MQNLNKAVSAQTGSLPHTPALIVRRLSGRHARHRKFKMHRNFVIIRHDLYISGYLHNSPPKRMQQAGTLSAAGNMAD